MEADTGFEKVLADLCQDQSRYVEVIKEIMQRNHDSMRVFCYNQKMNQAIIARKWRTLSIPQRCNLQLSFIELQRMLIEKKMIQDELLRLLLRYQGRKR